MHFVLPPPQSIHCMVIRSHGHSLQNPMVHIIRSSSYNVPQVFPNYPTVGNSVEMPHANKYTNQTYPLSNWKPGGGFDTRCSYQEQDCSVNDIHYYYMLHNILLELSSSLVSTSHKEILSNKVLDAFGKPSNHVRGMHITAGGLLDDFSDFF